MHAAGREATDDALFHEWRKRVKELLYQTATISDVPSPLHSGCDSLSSLLGEQHDLALLTERLDRELPESVAARVSAARKARVTAQALDLGCIIFSEKTSVWLTNLRNP
jgi:hypothetical protein